MGFRSPVADTSLVRALGVRTLAASIVNATIGAGIFVLPAAVGHLGPAAPVAYLVCALAMALIVTCFAMAGSRVALTGGLYAYVEVAFGSMLGSPRLLFAFGRDGLLPPALARVHPRYRTPHLAILVYAVVVAGLALIGSFGVLVLLSNIATLPVYLLCCAGAWALARRDVRSGGEPFRAPGGAVLVPLLACAAILWLLSRATWREITAEMVVLAVASAFYFLRPSRWREGS